VAPARPLLARPHGEPPLNAVFDAFWRAAAYCLHPRVIAWSLLPLLAAGAVVLGLGWLYWEAAVAAVRGVLEQWALMSLMLQWLEAVGLGSLRAVIAPLIVVALALPAIVLTSLLLVAWTMTPAMVRLVAERRFPTLQRRGHASAWWQGLAWSVGCGTVALLALVVSVPLWLVPPLAFVVPALVWGWLAAKVFGFDALAAHADVAERRQLLHSRRWPLLAMGVATGLLGTAPSAVWALGAVALIFAPLLAVVSVWLYLLVFAFGSLWFAHYALDQLQRLRDAERPPIAVAPTPSPVALPEPARP
jgi:hypothetical protein